MEDPRTKPSIAKKVLDSYWTLAIAVMVAGPFALPLLWRSPRFGRTSKVLLTIAIIGLTVGLVFLAKWVHQQSMEMLQELQEFQ